MGSCAYSVTTGQPLLDALNRMLAPSTVLLADRGDMHKDKRRLFKLVIEEMKAFLEIMTQNSDSRIIGNSLSIIAEKRKKTIASIFP